MFSHYRFPVRFIQALVVVVMVLTSLPLAAPGVAVYAETTDPAVWKYLYNAPVVSLFSGAATYNYPIEVPAGRNGLAPQVAISYSSRRVDGMVGVEYVDAGPLGMGWSLEQMDIVRNDIHACEDKQHTCFRDDHFTLLMNGTGYDLAPAGSPFFGRFYAKDAPGLYVERRNDCHSHERAKAGDFYAACVDAPLNGSPYNETGDYWVVRLSDGMEARLGYTTNSEQAFSGYGDGFYVAGGYGGKVGGRAVKRWRVDKITNVFGDQLEYTYQELGRDGAAGQHWSLLTEVRYNYVDNGSGGTYLSRVKFQYDGNTASGEAGPLSTTIEVWDGSPQRLVRWYDLDVLRTSTSQGLKIAYLTRIQVLSAGGQSLPATTFGYVSLENWAHSWYLYPRVATVDSGYGGLAAFGYGAGDGYRVTDTDDGDAFPIRNPEAVGQTYPVAEMWTYDGLTPGSVVRYEYSGACRGNTGSPCAGRIPKNWGGAVVGYSATTERFYDYSGAVLAVRNHQFNIAYALLGRETQVQARDGSGVLLQQTDTTYSTSPLGSTTWVHVDAVATTDYSGGASRSTRTVYTYDDYGNTTKVFQYGAEERVLNAGFETPLTVGWAPGEGWSAFGSPTPASIGTEDAFAGRSSLRLAGATPGGGACQDIAGLVPGATYTVRVWVKAASSTSGRFRLWLSGNTDVYSSAQTPPTSWTQVSLNCAASAQGTIRVHLHYPVSGSGAIYVDEVAVARAGDVGDERSTYSLYYNLYDSRWLIGLKWIEDIYEGIQPLEYRPELKTQTIWYYDDDVAYDIEKWQQDPFAYITQGEVTMVGRGRWDKRQEGQFVTTRFKYDQYGNLTDTWDPLGHHATTSYDSTYHLYPMQACKLQTGGPSLCSTTEYYGINGVSLDGGLPGQVRRAWGPNEVYSAARYLYDGFGRLTKVVRPGDSLTHPSEEYLYYDGGSAGVPRTDAWPFMTLHLVRGTSNVDWWQGGVGAWERSFYDGLGRLVQTNRPDTDWGSAPGVGHEIVADTVYDALGRVVEQSVPYRQVHPPYNLNPNGTLQSFYAGADPNQPRTVTGYDVLGRVSVVTAPDSTQTKHYYGFDSDPNVGTPNPTGLWAHSTEDANGHSKHYIQDAYGRLVIVRDFTGTCYPGTPNCTDPMIFYGETHYTYDALDNLTQVTDAADGPSGSNVTTMLYDALGRKTWMDDPDMGEWYYGYDDASNLIYQIDARRQAINFYYDDVNRLRGKTYNAGPVNPATYVRPNDPGPGGYAVRYGYDAFNPSGGLYGKGRRTSMNDASGTTLWYYDPRGRTTREEKTISGNTFTTYYLYDAMDRVTRMTYPDGEQVYHTYNAAGALKSLTGANSYVQDATYNALGQVTALPLGNGLTTSYAYDPLNFRLRHAATGGLLDLYYGYDPVGNVTEIVDGYPPAFQDTFDSKNTANWAWSSYQTVPFNDGGKNVVRSSGTGSGYDANFYRQAYSLTNDEGLRLRFKVDRTDTFAYFAVESGDWSDPNYERFGVIASDGLLYVQVIHSENGQKTFIYPANLILNLQVNTWYVLQIVADDGERGFYVEAYQESNPAVRGSYSRAMPAGRQWRFHHWIYQGNAYIDDYKEFDTVQRFTYDALDRLTHAQAAGSGPGAYDRTYAYDPIGNIDWRKEGSTTFDYAYPASGPTSVRPHAVSSVTGKGWSYSYDANGNMTTRTENGTYNQTFNAENKLVQVSGAANASFTYDGEGNRVKKVENGVTTYYVGGYYEKQGSTVTKYYTFGAQRVAMRKGGNLYYLHGDHLGSTSLATNATGGLVSRVLYYPYGEERPGGAGALPTDYRFTGQRREGFGLYDYVARFYDPALGRFVSADTIVPSPSNPQDWNRYAYTRNNPLKYVDPTGHCGADALEGLTNQCEVLRDGLAEYYHITISGQWTYAEMVTFQFGLQDIETELGGQDFFREVYAGVEITRDRTVMLVQGGEALAYTAPDGNIITMLSGAFARGTDVGRWTVIHESAHVWDFRSGFGLSDGPGGHFAAVGGQCAVGTNCGLDPNDPPGSYVATAEASFSLYALTNPLEDTAETIAGTTFGGDWNTLMANVPGLGGDINSTPIRQSWAQGFIQEWRRDTTVSFTTGR